MISHRVIGQLVWDETFFPEMKIKFCRYYTLYILFFYIPICNVYFMQGQMDVDFNLLYLS